MRNPVDIAIGSKVRRLREHARLTELEFASRLKIDVNQLAQIECGLSRAGSEILDVVSRIFGVPVWSFFDGSADQLRDEREEVSTPKAPTTLH